MKIKVAFQGGGARLALFLPVIKALQQFENDGKIQVTAVSGTSAGSIAATLLAGRAKIDTMISHCQSIKKADLEAAFPSINIKSTFQKMKIFRKFYFEEPFGNEEKLAKIIERALKKSGINANKISDLEIPCYIASANLMRQKPEIASGDSQLLQSLIDSSALPFIYRMKGATVDGGILDNLPTTSLVEPLGGDLDDSITVAIGFSVPGYSKQVESPLQLGARLIDAAISEKTERAKLQLGAERVYEIRTKFNNKEIYTFSLDSFLEVINTDTILEAVEAETTDWLTKLIASQSTNESFTGSLGSTSVSDVRNNKEIRKSQSSSLRRIASAYHKKSDRHFSKTLLRVNANCLNEPNETDEVKYVDEFIVKDEIVFSYVTKIFMSNSGEVSAEHLNVFDKNSQQIPIVTFSIPDSEEKHTWNLVLFEEPIKAIGATETFTLISSQKGTQAMRPLLELGADYLTIQINQANSADVAEICLNVPEDIGIELHIGNREVLDRHCVKCEDDPEDDARLVEGKQIEPTADHFRDCPPKFRPYVWRAEGLKKSDLLRVVYVKK